MTSITQGSYQAEILKIRKKFMNPLVDALDAITDKQRVKEAPKAAAKLSKKAQAVQAVIISEDFGCKKEKVASLMSAVLGEEIYVTTSVTSAELVKVAGFCVVCENGNPNSHDYTEGEVAVLESDGGTTAWRKSGSTGNNLPFGRDKKYMRPATRKEIENFVYIADEKVIQILMKKHLK